MSPEEFHPFDGMKALTDLTLRECDGLTTAGFGELTRLRLVKLSMEYLNWDDAGFSLQALVGSNISDTLDETLVLVSDGAYSVAEDALMRPDDVQLARALASCHKLKSLRIDDPADDLLFGHNGLEGLRAMATGCPLLAEVTLFLTASAIHCLGTHFPKLEKCNIILARPRSTNPPEGYPSVEELRTLYPAVTWVYW